MHGNLPTIYDHFIADRRLLTVFSLFERHEQALKGRTANYSFPVLQSALFFLVLLAIASNVLSDAPTVYLRYITTDVRSWDGSCDPSCTGSSPCDFNNTDAGYLIQNVTSVGCRFAIQIDSNSDAMPVLTLDASQLSPNSISNLTFVQVSNIISWKSLVITTSLPLVFVPMQLLSPYTMSGNATFKMPASSLFFFATTKAVNFQYLSLSNPRFTFLALPESDGDQFASTVDAAISASFVGCEISTTNNATGSNFLFDTSLITTLTGSPTAFNPGSVDMIYNADHTAYSFSSSTLASDAAYHASFISYGSESSTARVTWSTTTTTGRTLGLFRSIAAMGSNGAPPINFFLINHASFGDDSTLYESAAIASVDSSGSNFQMILMSSVNASFSPVNDTRTSILSSTSGETFILLSSDTAVITGLLLDETVSMISSSSTSFINCEFQLRGASWDVQGTTSLSYQDNVTPTPTGGEATTSNFINVAFLFLDDADISFVTDYQNSLFSTFTFANSTFMKSDSASSTSDCRVTFDKAMMNQGPCTIVTQCNLTSTGFLNRGTDAANVSAFAGAYGTFGPSLAVSTAQFSKTNLFLSNFRLIHINPVALAQPFFTGDAGSTINGVTKSGVVIDWRSDLPTQPLNNVSYEAFQTRNPSLSSVQQLNSTASTVTSKLFTIAYIPLNDDVGTTNVTFTPGTLPSAAVPPTASPSTAPGSPPVALVCRGASPGSSFTCVSGVWVSNGTVVQTTVVISTTSVVVTGNLTVQTITFSGTSHNVTVTGCVSVEGITLDLTQENPGTLSGKTINLISQGSNCTSSLASVPVSIKQPEKNCATVKSSSSSTTESSSSQTSLSVLFSVDKSGCNTKWIIVGSVVGGVVVLAVIAAIVSTVVLNKAKTNRSRSNLRQAGL